MAAATTRAGFDRIEQDVGCTRMIGLSRLGVHEGLCIVIKVACRRPVTNFSKGYFSRTIN